MAAIIPGTIPEGVSAEDWATLWQSELAALALDREAQEGFVAVMQALERAGRAPGERHDAAAGRSRADAPAGAAPAPPLAGPGGPGGRPGD